MCNIELQTLSKSGPQIWENSLAHCAWNRSHFFSNILFQLDCRGWFRVENLRLWVFPEGRVKSRLLGGHGISIPSETRNEFSCKHFVYDSQRLIRRVACPCYFVEPMSCCCKLQNHAFREEKNHVTAQLQKEMFAEKLISHRGDIPWPPEFVLWGYLKFSGLHHETSHDNPIEIEYSRRNGCFIPCAMCQQVMRSRFEECLQRKSAHLDNVIIFFLMILQNLKKYYWNGNQSWLKLSSEIKIIYQDYWIYFICVQ